MSKKYTCPPQKASGNGTFSDNLVGLQITNGGGLTQGNFEFTTSVTEKSNRDFNTGVFSEPINLDSLGLADVNQAKVLFEKNFNVYPNFDLSEITNFTLYGSMVKRISASIGKIINYYPAAIESLTFGFDYTSGNTAINIVYNSVANETKFDLSIPRLRNPFEVDFTTNATRNLELLEIPVSGFRNLTTGTTSFSLYYLGTGYSLTRIIPTPSITNGLLTVYVQGNPFSGKTQVNENLIIRPNDYEVNKIFNETFDEVEKFLLNRNVTPKYTANFRIPSMSDDGTYYTRNQTVSWPIYGEWNLDIITNSFETYIEKLNEISQDFDSYKTNLISRFLITGAFNEFDTDEQKVHKVLQLYGRSFDETKKFIDALAYMNSVNYNIGNDIPSKLLKNLAGTLGWKTNISPISQTELLESVFGQKNSQKSDFSGVESPSTPDELNYQYFRNIILNSAYLFKSKGTRRSIEYLLKLIGAPEALTEFNEHIYLVDQKINMSNFDTQFVQISGGTYVQELPVYDPLNTFTIFGVKYSGYTTQAIYSDANILLNDYPIDDYGYPYFSNATDSFFFQMGSGWFEQTPSHRAPEEIDLTNSVFTGLSTNYQTMLKPYTYGQDYLNRYRKFPYMDVGFNIRRVVDNNKSWGYNEVGFRKNSDANYDAAYYVEDERLVLNVKNIDLFMNPGQGIVYDIWYMSREYGFPFSGKPLKNSFEPKTTKKRTIKYRSFSLPYPQKGGVDWTEINPQPKSQTFFEFAQTFWKNMINVRNRQFASGGRSSSYPTLTSIFWKYLESEKLIGVKNNNFTYDVMSKYVDGMGDYWIRLVEQMVPATTIWNVGVKYENPIFHRQKYVWRRQRGCGMVPVECKPCVLTTNIFTYDCPIQTVTCGVYPYESNPLITSFAGVLGYLLNQYAISQNVSLSSFNLTSLNTKWYVDISIDSVNVVKNEFFNGVGYNNPLLSSPTNENWEMALMSALDDLKIYDLDYYLNENDEIVIFNSVCNKDITGMNITINVGVNFII